MDPVTTPDKREIPKPENEEVDEKGVPVKNRIAEIERKLSDKYDKEMAALKQEISALKAAEQAEDVNQAPVQTNGQSVDPKAKLMKFVEDPDAYIDAKVQARDQARQQEAFQAQVIEAEKWLRSQSGYVPADDAEIFRVIKENKLDTPYHWPMERAKTAWKMLNAEKMERTNATMTDEQKRELSLRKTSTEGGGKPAPVKMQASRADLIKKLGEAERKGDLDASIYYMDKLEDTRE